MDWQWEMMIYGGGLLTLALVIYAGWAMNRDRDAR